jgi:hypothetical protein
MFGLTLLSMIFSYVGLAGCQFIRISSEETTPDDGQVNSYGFFNQVIYDRPGGDKIGCLPYDKDVRDEYFSDSAWGAGRAFGIMTVVALTVAFFMLALVMLFLGLYKDTLWLILKALYVIAFLTNLFTFSVFAADVCSEMSGSATSCKAGPAGGLAIFNIFILIFLIIMSWLVPPPPNPVFRRWEDPSSTLEEIVEVCDVKEGDEHGLDTVASKERFMEYDDKQQEQPVVVIEKDGDNGEGEEKPYDEERHETDMSMDTTTTTSRPDENVQITTEITPDGKKIVEVVTHPDGSKTVTTTIEALEDDYEDGMEVEINA